jgi:hypothetical protein
VGRDEDEREAGAAQRLNEWAISTLDADGQLTRIGMTSEALDQLGQPQPRVCGTRRRSRTWPISSMTQAAWLSDAQSSPAYRFIGSPSGAMMDTPPESWEALVGRSLFGALWRYSLWPIRVARAAGGERSHAGRQATSERARHPGRTRGSR